MGASRSVLLADAHGAPEALALARVAEQAGFSRVWIAETRGPDAFVLGALVASQTHLEVGTAIVPAYSRSPAVLAMAASDLAAISGRPVHLGIGAGGQVIVERWHGVAFDKPLATVGDTLVILRQSFAGERTDHEGAARSSRGFQLAGGAAGDVRLYVGGMGPKMREMAAAEADGLILTWLSPRITAGAAAALRADVEAAGRQRAAVRLVTRAYATLTDRPDEVREAVRSELVEYVASPPYARYFASVGFEPETAGVAKAFEAGDRGASRRAVSDRLVDEFLIAARSPRELRERLDDYADAGADDVMLQPVPQRLGGDPHATVRGLGG